MARNCSLLIVKAKVALIMKKLILSFLILSSFWALASGPNLPQKRIVFLGDSLTEGYGVDKEYSYPSIIQQKLDKTNPKKYKIINGGVSGSTTASGVSRLRWFLKAKPSILVLALGANDGLRGIKVSESKKNLEKIIQMGIKNNLKVILCEMHLPTNYGTDYRKSFNQMFRDVQNKYKTGFIPFMLKGVGGKKELNIEDGIHPNINGHKIVAENVLKHLREYL